MASSSKVMFHLATLQEKALESIDQRISSKQLEVDSFASEEALQERVKAWRARQEKRLKDVCQKLSETDDLRLSKFQLEDIPNVDRWERNRACSELESLKNRRSAIVAKSGALVPDADGNIALTKLQLQEFFDL